MITMQRRQGLNTTTTSLSLSLYSTSPQMFNMVRYEASYI